MNLRLVGLKDHGAIGNGSDYATVAALRGERTAARQAWQTKYAAWEAVPPTDKAAAAQAAAEVDQAWDHASYIEDYVTRIQDLALYLWLSPDFKSLRRNAIVAAAIGAAGIALFAWAANPPAPAAHPPGNLAGASLIGANLRGANLQGADLTGADLRLTDLSGANLTGAHTSGVKWGGTTCPDGVNSNDPPRGCDGHLTPAP